MRIPPILTLSLTVLLVSVLADTAPAGGDGFDVRSYFEADIGGKIAVDAQLLATEAEMAESLASIARGLISLASFDEDMEPGVAEVLRSTKVNVKDSTLKISLAVDPEVFVTMLQDD